MKYSSVVMGVLLLFSCRKIEKIEKAGNIQPRLIVNCVAAEGEPFVIYVNKSLSALDNAPMKPVANAVVKLYKNGVFLDTAKYDASSTSYISNKETPQVGVKYSVEVSSRGLASVKAFAVIPGKVNITKTSIEIKEKQLDSFYRGFPKWSYQGTFKSGSMRISFQDKPGENNYYMLTIMDNWQGPGGKVGYYSTYWKSDRLGLEAVRIYDGQVTGSQYFFNDYPDDGKEINLEFKSESGGYNYFMNDNDSLLSYTITLYSLTEDYSRHLYSLSLAQQNEGNPFAEPVQIYSNVENGYGVFGGKSSAEAVIPFPY